MRVVFLVFFIFQCFSDAWAFELSLTKLENIPLSFSQRDTMYKKKRFSLNEGLDFSRETKYHLLSEKIRENSFYQMTYAAVPIMAASGIYYALEKDIYNMRQNTLSSFRYKYDDYLQYAPMGLTYVLKASGVESRSSWGRMLTANAMSHLLMTGVVTSMKNMIHKERPDKSADNSFPSGHTATAFMSATILHKEYGLTCSPLYSVLGYGIATATGVSRILNNKHWLSDILAGAGIGIFTTELGYYLTDLIFKGKGIRRANIPNDCMPMDRNPSFISLNLGYLVNNVNLNLTPDVEIDTYGGSASSIEGAWFFLPNFGIGAKLQLLFLPTKVQETSNLGKIYSYSPIALNSLFAGGYFSLPLAYGLMAGANVSAGMCVCDNWSMKDVSISPNGNYLEKKLLWSDKGMLPSFGISASLGKMLNNNLMLKLQIDYQGASGEVKFFNSPRFTNEVYSYKVNQSFHTLVIGGTVTALLWSK